MTYKLVPKVEEPNNAVIEMLEKALVAAKSGKLKSAVIIGDCGNYTAWMTRELQLGCNLFQMVGAIEVQKQLFLSDFRLQGNGD